MLISKLFFFSSAFIAISAVYLHWMGAFKPIYVSEGKIEPWKFFYKFHKGEYDATVGHLFGEAEKVTTEINMKFDSKQYYKGLCGMYYDDPKKTPQNEKRMCIGAVFNPSLNPKINKEFEDRGFKVTMLPAAHALVTTFPFKNFISVFLGMFKAYPALNLKMEEIGLLEEVEKSNVPIPFVNIYDEAEEKIFYNVIVDENLSVRKKFLVKEANSEK